MVSGQIALSLDGTPAEAIRFLSDVVSDATRLGHGGTFGIAGALTVLHKAIRSDTVSSISVSLFDEYLSMTAKTSSKVFATEAIANAKLYHPVTPDPWQMFHLMEGYMARCLKVRQKIRLIRWDKMGFIYIRLMFILHLEGAVAEAKTMSEVLQDHFASVWRKRHSAIARIKKDPKLQQLQAQHRNAVNGGQPNKLPKNDAANDDLIDGFGPWIEEPDYDVSSELVELRSRRREDDPGVSKPEKM
jgi:hypothetical protein